MVGVVYDNFCNSSWIWLRRLRSEVRMHAVLTSTTASSDALDRAKNFLKGMRKLGLITWPAMACMISCQRNWMSPSQELPYPPQKTKLSHSKTLKQLPSRASVCLGSTSRVSLHITDQRRRWNTTKQSIYAQALSAITPYLTRICSVSLCQGIFPHFWKEARILALKKEPVPSLPSDFLPYVSCRRF